MACAGCRWLDGVHHSEGAQRVRRQGVGHRLAPEARVPARCRKLTQCVSGRVSLPSVEVCGCVVVRMRLSVCGCADACGLLG
eukprot:2782892-Rhodomonas_salina.1